MHLRGILQRVTLADIAIDDALMICLGSIALDRRLGHRAASQFAAFEIVVAWTMPRAAFVIRTAAALTCCAARRARP
jgi:hypothetical protein